MHKWILALFLFSTLSAGPTIIQSQKQLAKLANPSDTLMICTPGRSGSYMLYYALHKILPEKTVVKSHLLPPGSDWKGKILFVFSSPDKIAESIFHLTLEDRNFIYKEFQNGESVDFEWINQLAKKANENYGQIVMNLNQTIEENMLTHDVLGIEAQLEKWLHTSVEDAPKEECTILAVKLENLWDEEVLDAIKDFCGLASVELPKKKERGHKVDSVCTNEQLIRGLYNLGTEKAPMYAAYDGARALWRDAPKFQTLRLVKE